MSMFSCRGEYRVVVTCCQSKLGIGTYYDQVIVMNV